MPPISRAILPLALGGVLAAASPALGASGPRAIAAAPSAQRLDLVIPLVADDAGLRAFAQGVSTPGSALYGRYEPVPLLAERFGATPVVQRRALRFLRSAGATGVWINETRMFADATMTVGRAERTFGVTLARYADTAGNPSFIAPALSASTSRAQPSLPAGLVGVATGVIGLDTRRLAPSLSPPRSGPGAFAHASTVAAPHSRARAARTASGYLPVSGTQAGCAAARGSGSGFTPNQYTTAYGIAPLRAAGLRGQGERIALIEVDGYRSSDIKRFAACFGLDIPALNPHLLGARHLLAPGGESTLDLEITDAVAPNLKAIDVYENTGNAAAVTRSVVLPLLSPGAKPAVISASLGRCEPELELAFNRATLTSIERDVELAAATGITLVVAAGDTGSSDCTSSRGGVIARRAVAYPASSPFVTAVGGTNLLLGPPTKSRPSSSGMTRRSPWPVAEAVRASCSPAPATRKGSSTVPAACCPMSRSWPTRRRATRSTATRRGTPTAAAPAARGRPSAGPAPRPRCSPRGRRSSTRIWPAAGACRSVSQPAAVPHRSIAPGDGGLQRRHLR